MALTPKDKQDEKFDAAWTEADARLKGTLAGPPSPEQVDAQAGMVEQFGELYASIYCNIESSRLRSIALTKLEEAKMFAVAAIFND